VQLLEKARQPRFVDWTIRYGECLQRVERVLGTLRPHTIAQQRLVERRFQEVAKV